jgi:glycosyltransferase involved in cell wall biosynthesis
LSNSAVVACPSIHDTWSIAVAEAMAMGAVPVVSSSLGDMIIESGTGAICSTGDSISLAQSINRILADPSKWYDMSRRASKWARENTWDKVADQTLNVVLERLT